MSDLFRNNPYNSCSIFTMLVFFSRMLMFFSKFTRLIIKWNGYGYKCITGMCLCGHLNAKYLALSWKLWMQIENANCYSDYHNKNHSSAINPQKLRWNLEKSMESNEILCEGGVAKQIKRSGQLSSLPPKTPLVLFNLESFSNISCSLLKSFCRNKLSAVQFQ